MINSIFQDLENLISDECILNLVTNLLWPKKQHDHEDSHELNTEDVAVARDENRKVVIEKVGVLGRKQIRRDKEKSEQSANEHILNNSYSEVNCSFLFNYDSILLEIYAF